MTELPHLGDIFDRLKRGAHLGPEDEPFYSDLVARYDDYAAYFAPLGLRLIRHPREFFYFDPENSETVPDTLPRIAIFSYIMVDFAANQGQPIEEYIFSRNFLISSLPHFAFDRYAALLRQVEIHDTRGLESILQQMKRIGWVHFISLDEFRFLRHFHRVFARCIDIAHPSSVNPVAPAAETPHPAP